MASVVAIQAWVSVGSADELPEQAGICHVMEHMHFKRTTNRGVGEIASEIESAGGEINAWTSQDNTVFHLVMPSRYAEIGIDVLSDLLTNPALDSGDLAREREVIVEEIRQGRDEPMRRLAQTLFTGAFRGHTYGNPVIGSEESVRGFRSSDLHRFRKRWYRGNNISLVISGGFNSEKMKARIEEDFAAIPAGPKIRRQSRGNFRAGRSASAQVASLSQSQVALAFPMPPLGHSACVAMDLLTIVLGQGESSILTRDLVRGRELCKSAYAYLHALRNSSLAVVGISSDPMRLRNALVHVGESLQRLRNEPISKPALEKARRAIRADSIYQRETAEGTALAVGTYLSLTGDPNFEEKYVDQVASIDAEQIRQVAEEYFDPQRMHLSALVPTSTRHTAPNARTKMAQRLLGQVDKGFAKAVKRKKNIRTKTVKKKPLIVRHTLENGMTVVIQEDSSVPIVAARAVWSGGQLFENSQNAGITELLASSITRGCKDRSAIEIIDEVDSQSATLAGFAGRNSFGVRAEWLAEYWQSGFDLFANCLLSPTFDKEEVQRAHGRQIARIGLQRENPSQVAFSLFHETMFRKHPYRNVLSGTEGSLRGIGSLELEKQYREKYPLSELTLAVVGDVDAKEVIARIESRFGSKPAGNRPPRKVIKEVFAGRSQKSREVYGVLNREQSQLVVGFPGVAIDDSERASLEVLTTVLGGQGGRLFAELRDRQSLAYQLGAFSLEGLDPGYVAIYLSCTPSKVDLAIAGVRAQIDAIKSQGITKEELQRSKRLLIGTHEISLQRRSSVAAALAFHQAYGLSYDEHLHYLRRIEKVRLSDVQRVANRILDWDLAVQVSVGPAHASPAAAKRVRGSVKKIRKNRRAK